MLISIVIPAWNGSATIGRALNSVVGATLPRDWQLEIIVIDDGSDDSEILKKIIAQYQGVLLFHHQTNLGMCAARNSGIGHSAGDIVFILDCDDELVTGWPVVLSKILQEWPSRANICFAGCVNQHNNRTTASAGYTGELSFSDMLNERFAGEYIPVFRGEYVRSKPYIDLQMRVCCGVVSYLAYAMDGPLWISDYVLRVYHEGGEGSFSHGWTSQAKAAQLVTCYEELLARYKANFLKYAPRTYLTRLLRLAFFKHLAGQRGTWRIWWQGASFSIIKETIAVAIILLAGRKLGRELAILAKSKGLVKRYG